MRMILSNSQQKWHHNNIYVLTDNDLVQILAMGD